MMSAKKKNISGVSEDVSASIKKDLSSKVIDTSRLFYDRKLAISISESEDLEYLGFSIEHLQDAMVEFARHSLIQGAQLIYGGDLRKDGFTLILSDLSYQYRDKNEYKKEYVFNYSSYPIYLNFKPTDELELKKNRVKLVKVAPPKNIKKISESYFPPVTLEQKTEWADSLTKMRIEMNESSDARIFLGGRCSGYSGSMPGLLEEALISIKSNKPTFLIGAYGGVTAEIIKAIQGKDCERLSEVYQKKNDDYAKFFDHYKKVNYTELVNSLKHFGIKSLSKNNGLTEDENMILFETKNISEMIFYVMKGLKKALK